MSGEKKPALRCPQCRKPTVWQGNASRPFCSPRCKMQDLEGWMNSRYRIAGAPLNGEAAGGGQTEADSEDDRDL